MNKGRLSSIVQQHTDGIKGYAMLDSQFYSRKEGRCLWERRERGNIFSGLWRQCHLFCCNVG
jgi:hypothetical protein